MDEKDIERMFNYIKKRPCMVYDKNHRALDFDLPEMLKTEQDNDKLLTICADIMTRICRNSEYASDQNNIGQALAILCVVISNQNKLVEKLTVKAAKDKDPYEIK